jgi:hypothetical protein
LSQAFWVIGAFLSNICVASCVFRQPNNVLNYENKPLQSNDAQVEMEEAYFLTSRMKQMINREILLKDVAMHLT